MKEDYKIVGFDDVKAIFESHSIWFGGHEIYWYQRAWECLEKGNLTAYSNNYERAIVYIRVFTLIMIYGEFCELALDEPYSYEFFRDDFEAEEILSDYAVGQLIMKHQYEFNKLPHHSCEIKFYNKDGVESAFFDLISEERHRVFNAIEKNISTLHDIELILASMYITAVTPFKNKEEDILEEIDSYEDYLSVCERYVNDISELIYKYDDVYGWLLEGTYKI